MVVWILRIELLFDVKRFLNLCIRYKKLSIGRFDYLFYCVNIIVWFGVDCWFDIVKFF